MADTPTSLQGMIEQSQDVMQTDLSVQLLAKIFGSGWENLAATLTGGSADGVMGTLIFDLMFVLNSCCAVAVAWMFILTTLSATLGAAQDGSGLGGRRYSNAWIPLRLSFAMGAITPVFNGLNAMQLMVLTCLGLSIQFADDMWSTGIKHISTVGAINASGNADVSAAAQRVLPLLIEHAALKEYLERSSGDACTFAQTREVQAGLDGGSYIITFELPYPQTCTIGGLANSQLPTVFGDLGTITVSTSTKAASEALYKAIVNVVYPKVEQSVKQALAMGESESITTLTPYTALQIKALAEIYASAVSPALANAAVQTTSARNTLLQDFSQYASAQGWFMAGSYYWSLARLSAQTVEMLRDQSTISPINYAALTGLKNPELTSRISLAKEMAQTASKAFIFQDDPPNPITGKQATSSIDAQAEASGLVEHIGRYFSGASQAIAEWKLDSSNVGGNIISLIGSNDIVFNTVRAARTLMNVSENVFLGYLTIRLGASAASHLPGILGSLFSSLDKGVEVAGSIAIKIAAPLWVICWFYAYMLPMLPFIAWFTAVLGWVVLTLEAIAACPVWLVGHCMPEGDGFAGQSARAGYALFLSILLRPMLLVLAFFLCMIVMSVSGSLVGALLMPFFDAQSGAFQTSSGFGTNGWGLTATLSTVILIGFIVGIATWKLFTLVTVMPDRIIRWAGQLIANLGDSDAGHTMLQTQQKMQGATNAIAGGAGALAIAATTLRQPTTTQRSTTNLLSQGSSLPTNAQQTQSPIPTVQQTSQTTAPTTTPLGSDPHDPLNAQHFSQASKS